jgi:nucleoside transporter
MPRASKLQISVLMFLHAFALGAYVVPLPTVMAAYGLGDHVTLVFIMASLAAFISPLIFGSLADRKFGPEPLLGIVTLGAGLLMVTGSLCLSQHWTHPAFLIVMAAYFLWASPGWGLLTSIGLMNLSDPQREFAPLRVWATIGFMVGIAFVSFVMKADRSASSFLVSGGFFLVESVFCLTLPRTRPPESAAPKRLRDYFGWDAWQLLRERDHCMIFLTTALFSIPLAAFYLYTSKHLDSLKVEHPAGVLSLAQVAEVVSMLGLAAIMKRFRLKWLILAGMVCGILRYAFFSSNLFTFIVAGISLHGLIFTLFTMTTQIYVEQRVPHQLRNQAQALLLLMTGGIGNLSGYLISAWWFAQCTSDHLTDWSKFWSALTASIVVVALFFLVGYHGQKHTHPARPEPE